MRFPKDLKTLDRLKPTPWTLMVFVDDTGDETRTDDGQPFFGMGGCAAHAQEIERLISQPWREVRRVITGSPDSPLHASKMRPPFDPAHLAALAGFFGDNHFMRFGVSCHRDTQVPPPCEMTYALLASLQHRLNDLLRRFWASDLAVIFEHSERLEKTIMVGFDGFTPHQFGRALPWTPCFMPKWANEPALEVADFVAHAVGSQARQAFQTSGARYRRDFQAIFYSVDRALTSYMHICEIRRVASV